MLSSLGALLTLRIIERRRNEGKNEHYPLASSTARDTNKEQKAGEDKQDKSEEPYVVGRQIDSEGRAVGVYYSNGRRVFEFNANDDVDRQTNLDLSGNGNEVWHFPRVQYMSVGKVELSEHKDSNTKRGDIVIFKSVKKKINNMEERLERVERATVMHDKSNTMEDLDNKVKRIQKLANEKKFVENKLTILGSDMLTGQILGLDYVRYAELRAMLRDAYQRRLEQVDALLENSVKQDD